MSVDLLNILQNNLPLSSDKNVLLQATDQRTSILTKLAMYIDIKFAFLIIAQNEFQKNIKI